MTSNREGATALERSEQDAKGMRWCYRDQAWEPVEAFGVDRSRLDGRTTSCRRSLNARRRKRDQ